MKDLISRPVKAMRIGRHDDVQLTFGEDSIVPDGPYRIVAGLSWPDDVRDGYAVLCVLECKENGRAFVMEQEPWQVANPMDGLTALADLHGKWKNVYLRFAYFADISGPGSRIFAPQLEGSIHFEPGIDLRWAGWGDNASSISGAIQALAQRGNEGRLIQETLGSVHLAMTKYETDPKVILPPLRAMMSAGFGLDQAQRDWDDELERWRMEGKEEKSGAFKLSGLQGLV